MKISVAIAALFVLVSAAPALADDASTYQTTASLPSGTASSGITVDSTMASCTLEEDGACEHQCIDGGPGNGPNAPKNPVFVNSTCVREYEWYPPPRDRFDGGSWV